MLKTFPRCTLSTRQCPRGWKKEECGLAKGKVQCCRLGGVSRWLVSWLASVVKACRKEHKTRSRRCFYCCCQRCCCSSLLSSLLLSLLMLLVFVTLLPVVVFVAIVVAAAVLFSFVEKFSAAFRWLHKFLNNQHTQTRAAPAERTAEKRMYINRNKSDFPSAEY